MRIQGGKFRYSLRITLVKGPALARYGRFAYPTMEEVVACLSGNLEVDEAEPFSRHDGLPTFTAVHDRCKSHGLPPQPCLFFLVGQFVSERFQILVGFVQTRANLVDRAEHRQVVDSDIQER